jgi:hypothetical protein
MKMIQNVSNIEKGGYKMKETSYQAPLVLEHRPLVFETLISCDPPSLPGQIFEGDVQICVNPDDHTWFPR